MSAARLLFLIGTVSLGAAFIVLAAQIALTPEAWELVAVTIGRLRGSLALVLVTIGAVVMAVLSECAKRWERDDRSSQSASK